MEYKVVPFIALIDPKKGNSADVAQQLENLIKNYTNSNWIYVGLESVTTYVHPNPGCFGFGAQPGYMTNNQMVVFKR